MLTDGLLRFTSLAVRKAVRNRESNIYCVILRQAAATRGDLG